LAYTSDDAIYYSVIFTLNQFLSNVIIPLAYFKFHKSLYYKIADNSRLITFIHYYLLFGFIIRLLHSYSDMILKIDHIEFDYIDGNINRYIYLIQVTPIIM